MNISPAILTVVRYSFLSGFLLLLAGNSLSAQSHKGCGVNAYYDGYPLEYLNNVSPSALESRSTTVLTVVIHVVWNKAGENIPDQQVLAQIDRLNEDFNDPDIDKMNVPKEFRPFIANPQIRFCLASKDPSGKSHSGITRTQTNIELVGSKRDATNKNVIHYTGKGGEDAWDPSKYINIWVGKLDNIFGRSTIGGNVPVVAEDGIVIDPDYFNSDLKTNKFGRTLVHEMGHYLGLLHIWGLSIGDCTEDDGLADTPPQEGPYYDCPKYPQMSCNASNMFMNYMDFVDDICMHFFTKDQVKVMSNTLLASRQSLAGGMSACSKQPQAIPIDSLSIKISSSKGVIQLESPALPEMNIYFLTFNALGQKITEQKLTIVQRGEINIKDWPAGIYFLYFRYNKEYRTIKFIKA
ncbi:MAG: zinc-dependent metalloprotease [Saprospiraceae bacterium]